MKEHTVNSDGEKNNQKIDQSEVAKCKKVNELIKNSIERRVTCSKKKFISKEEQSINAINALIIPEADRYKLTAIALKLHQSIQLTQSENKYWSNFSNQEKAYIIAGESQQTLDFTQYQEGYFSSEYWKYLARQEPQVLSPLTIPAQDGARHYALNSHSYQDKRLQD